MSSVHVVQDQFHCAAVHFLTTKKLCHFSETRSDRSLVDGSSDSIPPAHTGDATTRRFPATRSGDAPPSDGEELSYLDGYPELVALSHVVREHGHEERTGDGEHISVAVEILVPEHENHVRELLVLVK